MTEQVRHRSSLRDSARPPLASPLKGLPDSVFLVAGLILATVAVYVPVAGHEFVNYDDPDYLTSNPHVQSGLSWRNIAWAFRTRHASNWHPMTWLSHMLDCQLFGQSSGPPHLVNVGFHALNAALLFLVLRRYTGAFWRSGLVAALFALHPLHVESVAWISERKDLLSGTFFLLTLLAYGAYVRWLGGREANLLKGAVAYGLSLFCFLLGLMSKPMLVTLPCVLLLLDYWPLERLASARSTDVPAEPGQQRSLMHLLLEKVPFFALSLSSSVVTYIAQKHGGAVSTNLSFGARVANAFVAYVRYIAKVFWPVKLSVLYPHPGSWSIWQVTAACMFLLALTVVALAFVRSHRYLPVGWFWFIGMLVPVIGLVQVGVQSMADRYTYLPLIGLFIILVWTGHGVVMAKPGLRPLFQAGAAVSLILCVVFTSTQLRYWRNSEALFRHAIEVTKGNYLAYNNLGFYLSNHGKMDQAMEYYRNALAINPKYEDALNNMGYALAAQKNYVEAIGYYEAALRVRPDQVEVHNNLGNALADSGRLDEAMKHYLFVLERNPEHAEAHNNLGIALAMQGKLEEAITHFRKAIELKPGYASAHSNLGNAFAVQHKLEPAAHEYQEALRLNPNDSQAHNNFGNVLAEQGRLDEAIAQYHEALHLAPNDAEAHYNLGMALKRQGKREEALVQFREAVRLSPNYTQAKQQLLEAKPPETDH